MDEEIEAKLDASIAKHMDIMQLNVVSLDVKKKRSKGQGQR